MNKVKIFLFLGGLGTGILAPYAYNSLKNVFKSATQNNELVSRARYSPWISAHTSGMLLSESAVMVRFNQSPAEEIRNKISEDPGKFLDFSPSFKFKAEWQDDKTLRIIPEEPMKHGEKINCTLELSSIFKGVPDDCEEFEFAYSVVPKKLKFQAGVPEINEDGTAYDFSGTIYSSDKIKPDELYPLLTANEKLNITWSHEPDGRTHRFVINGIPRTNFDRVIQLTLKDWGSDEKYTFDLLVPRKNHFALISADIPANRDDAVLRMVFSDALSNKVPAESFVVPESALLKFNYVLQNNVLLIFPENIYDKKVKFTVFKNLKNIFGQNFGKDTILYFDIPDARPSVSFADKGNIIPPASEKEDILIPFESVNLKAVDVEIFKIFQDNLVSFFLFNNWDDNSNLTYYGKKVLSKTIPLNIINPADYKIKTRHFLNLKELIKTDPGCIYRVVLKFKKKYSACNCIGASDVYEASIQQLKADESEDAEFYAYYSDIDNTYYDEDEPYSWEQAKNPCHSSYYDGYNTMKARNFLVSNIGLTVKRTPGKKYHVFANDLNTTEPLKNVSIEAYSLQRKLLGTNTTDGDGHAEFNSPEPVALIVATKGHLKNYIRLDEYSLGTSMFEAGGNNSKKGAKVFLYTERGVWRPGDTVFLGVMTHARDKNYFNGLPVHLELLNPTGNVVYRVSKEYSENGLYTFAVPLPENAQLGFWSARVHAGPVTQSKTLRVDAIA
ncbi:MAG: MG2 domain-containing protein, partial [Bacteroidia bacterium]|nr:MG2 domain-containing protein [Bacteroidia bacterium]